MAGRIRLDERALALLVEDVAVGEALEEAAERVRLNAARLAPRRTGRLSRSIVKVKDRDAAGLPCYRVSWDRRRAFYGHLVEFGTSRTPARPFLRPAVNG